MCVAITGGERPGRTRRGPRDHGARLAAWRPARHRCARMPGRSCGRAADSRIGRRPGCREPVASQRQSPRRAFGAATLRRPAPRKPRCTKPETATARPKLAPAAARRTECPPQLHLQVPSRPSEQLASTEPAAPPPQAATQPPPQSDAAPAAPSQASVSTEKPNQRLRQTMPLTACWYTGRCAARLAAFRRGKVRSDRVRSAAHHRPALRARRPGVRCRGRGADAADRNSAPVRLDPGDGAVTLARGGNRGASPLQRRSTAASRSRRWWPMTVCSCRQQRQARWSARGSGHRRHRCWSAPSGSSGQGVAGAAPDAGIHLLPTWQGIAVEPKADTVVLRPTRPGFAVTGRQPRCRQRPEIADQLTALCRPDAAVRFPEPANRRTLAADCCNADTGDGTDTAFCARTAPRAGRSHNDRARAGRGGRLRPAPCRSATIRDLAAFAGECSAGGDRRIAGAPAEEADGLDRPRASRRPMTSRSGVPCAWPMSSRVRRSRGCHVRRHRCRWHSPSRRNAEPPAASGRGNPGGRRRDGHGGCLICSTRPRTTPSLDLARAMLAEARHDNKSGTNRIRPAGAIARPVGACSRGHTRRRVAPGDGRHQHAPGGRSTGTAALYVARRPQERALRERLAELQARSGNWRAALGLLRDTEALFPDQKATHSRRVARDVHGTAAQRRTGHAAAVGSGVAGRGER